MKIAQFQERNRGKGLVFSRFCDAEMGDFRHILVGRGGFLPCMRRKMLDGAPHRLARFSCSGPKSNSRRARNLIEF